MLSPTETNDHFHGPTFDLTVDNALRKAWATADYLVFRFHEIPGMPSYHRDAREVAVRATYRDRSQAETAREWRTRGYVRGGRLDATHEHDGHVRYSEDPINLYTPPSGAAWAVFVTDPVRAVCESLPAGAVITVMVRLDWASNGYMARAGLHGDVLMISARWKRGAREYQRNFVLDTDILPHNSARFGVSS